MVDIQTADLYFQTEVFLNDAWVNADEPGKSRALKNAENMLYRSYSQFNVQVNPVPEVAVFEQAYFLMLIDETIQKSALGVKQVSISGLSISVDAPSYPLSPEVKLIMQQYQGRTGGVKLGRTAL